MTAGDILAMLPLIVTAGAAAILALVTALRRGHILALTVTLTGLGAALATSFVSETAAPRGVTALITIDRYALFYTGLVLSAAFLTAMLSFDYFRRRAERPEEFYILLLAATAGGIVLVSSGHFVSFFLGLETLSVSLYAMIGYRRDSRGGTEAAIKYLVLGGVSSAFLLFGMALVYADTGTMAIAEISGKLAGFEVGLLTTAGLGMMLVAIGFKMALAPFHLWAADVYEGAPAPAAAFVASVSKGAVAALLMRFFMPVIAVRGSIWTLVALASIASMFAGNILALLQNNMKRILAYSSIANMGYLLVAFLAGGRPAAMAVSYFLVAYFVSILGAFGVVAMLSAGDAEADRLEDYTGLAWRRPGLAGVLTLTILSLAGVPLTVGFIGKFWLLYAGAGAGLWALAVILAANSAIGLFYYLRVIIALYRPQAEGLESARSAPAAASPGPALVGAIALAIIAAALIGLGVYPGPLVDLISATAASIF